MTEDSRIRKLSDDQAQIVRSISEAYHDILKQAYDLDRYEVTGAADPETVAHLVAERLPPEIAAYIFGAPQQLNMSELDENLQSLRADYGLSVKSDMSASAAIMIVLQAVYDYFLAVEASREVRLSSPEIAMLDIASRLPAGFERYMPKEA